MAYGLTPNMVTSARDPNMAVQISPESLGSSSETKQKSPSETHILVVAFKVTANQFEFARYI